MSFLGVPLGVGWAALLVAGWMAHPLGGPVRLFPQGTGAWNGVVVAATWARHAGLLAAAAAWVGALGGWGAPALAWTGARAGRFKRMAGLGLGFGLLGFATLGLGLAGLAFPLVLGAMTLVPLTWWAKDQRLTRPLRNTLLNYLSTSPMWPMWLAFAAPIVLALPAMLAPETSWDAMVYHLQLPATFLVEHRHFAMVDSPFAGYPGLTELHYLLGLAVTGSSDLAKLQHAVCWLLTARILYVAVGSYGVPAARVAALLWLVLPLGIQLAGMAYVDLATAWLAALAAALVFDGVVGMAAVCAGLAMATKYTGAFALVGVFAMLPPRRWHRTGHWAAIPAGLWLLRNWLVLGNPVYPFATRWFGGVASAAVEFWTASPPGTAVAGTVPYWQHPWLALVADDGGVGVTLSPLGLAVVIFGLANRRWRFAVAGGFVWWALRLDVRFLLPLVPAALLAPGEAWGTKSCRAAALAAIVLGAPFSAASAARGSFVTFDTLPPALGLRSHDAHLRSGLDPAPEYYDVALELGRRMPPRARLLFLSGIKNYYMPRRCSTAHQHICPVPLLRELRRAGSAGRLAIRLRQQGYTYMVDLVRTTITAVERSDAVPTEAEARILVAWLRQSTAYAFRTGEALVYRLGPQARPRRLGRVPLLEPSVVGPITSGHASVAAMTLLGSVAPESSSVGLARGLAALLAVPPRLREAREALERAVRDPEATALAWRGLGWAQDRTGDPGKALASFRQAAALNPSDVDSRYGAGMILANAGWWDQAAIELAAALRLAPARDDIRAALAAVAARQR